jgi:Tfp pilus assembly protein PilF
MVGGSAWIVYSKLTADPLAGARIAYQSGNYELARRAVRDHLRLKSGDHDALLLLARATARQGDDNAAKRLYKAIGPASLQAEDYFLVGASLLRSGQDDLARQAFQTAEEADPRHVEALAALSGLCDRYKMYEMAEGYAKRAAESPGGAAAGAALIGKTRLALGDPSAAAPRFAEALRIDPAVRGSGLSSDEVHTLQGRALLALGRGSEAEASLKSVSLPSADLSWLLSRAALQRGDRDVATTLLVRAKAEGSVLARDPMTTEPAPFTGSARCVDCHAEIHREQQSSRHARTFARMPELHNVPITETPVSDPHDTTIQHSIKKEGDKLVVQSVIDGSIRRAIVEFMMGSGDKGLTMLGRDEAGALRELRLSHYPGHGWDRTTGHPEKPPDRGDFLGMALLPDEQRRCLGCHTTDSFSVSTGHGPAATDRAIGCETCHGPAGNHILAIERGFADPAIARPRLASAEQTVALCGRCHKSPVDGPIGEPGDPFSVRFQAATLVRSACYLQSSNTLDCITCHDPHHDAETSASYYEAICLACHSSPEARNEFVQTGAREPVDPATLLDPSRRVSCSVNSRSGCIECHMPVSSSIMSHSKFADHHIRIHPQKNSPE